MDALDQALAALLSLARANEPAGIMPVNEAVDRFIAATHGPPQAKMAALERLERAFSEAAPATELGCYGRLVIGQRRRLLSLEPGTS